MKIGESLYFAPEIKFSDLDLSGKNLPGQLDSRMRAYYLEPAKALAQNGHAFASGLLLVSCIDALSCLQSKPKASVRRRFCSWIKTGLPSFGSAAIAERFYCEFRNGLVHEARIKKGGQFSLEQSCTMDKGIKIKSKGIKGSSLLLTFSDLARYYLPHVPSPAD